jgi:hypothetical protein
VAVYSPDRPHVIVHGEPRLSPWIAPEELRRRGGVLVWQEELAADLLPKWRATFGEFAAEPELILPRQTWRPVRPTRLRYALIPPRP